MRVRVIIDDREMPKTARRVLAEQLSCVPAEFSQECIWWTEQGKALARTLELTGVPKGVPCNPKLLSLYAGRGVDCVLFLSGNVLLRDTWWHVYRRSSFSGILYGGSVLNPNRAPRIAELDWFLLDSAHSSLLTLQGTLAGLSANGIHSNDLQLQGGELCEGNEIVSVQSFSLRPWYNSFSPYRAEWESALGRNERGLGEAIEEDVSEGRVRPSLRLFTRSATEGDRIVRLPPTVIDLDVNFVPPELRPGSEWRDALLSRKNFWASALQAQAKRFKKNPRGYIIAMLKRVVRSILRMTRRYLSVRFFVKLVRRAIWGILSLGRRLCGRSPHEISTIRGV